MSRRIARPVLAILVVAAISDAASAKGMERATLAGPGIDQPIVFLDQSREFGSLENQAPLHLMGMTGIAGHESTAIAPPKALGPRYTVTWSNFGGPDTVQHLYPDAVGGPVIHNPAQNGIQPHWFEAPERLGETIAELIAWASTPQGAAMQLVKPTLPTPLPSPSAASPVVWLAPFAPLAAAGILWRVHLRRAGLDQLT